MSERMNALDATFLELEEADQGAHMHIGAVMVFERQPGERLPSASEVGARIERGIEDLPRFGRRLSSPVTGSLSWPSWVDDDAFRAIDHVREVTLPAPGGDRGLREWAGEFFSSRLDRNRPLWEMAVIEGVADDRWALAHKTHHCLVDGVGSTDAFRIVLDTETHPAGAFRSAVAPPSAPRAPAARSPAAAAAALGGGGVRAVRRAARLPVAAANAAGMLLRSTIGAASHPDQMREALRISRGLAELIVRDELAAAPRSSLNVPIGAKRSLAVFAVPLEDLKQIKNSLGGTLNDVVLAIASGGLRELLIARREPPPEQGLRAMVPLSVRKTGEELTLGNRVASLFVPLPVAVADPLERYARQVEAAGQRKSSSQGAAVELLLELGGHAPPVIHSFLARATFAPRLFNVVITNIPGPRMPLYGLGSRMLELWPVVPLGGDHAVGLAVISYNGTLFFTLNADRDTMPDLDLLAEAMRQSLEELREASCGDAASVSGAARPRPRR